MFVIKKKKCYLSRQIRNEAGWAGVAARATLGSLKQENETWATVCDPAFKKKKEKKKRIVLGIGDIAQWQNPALHVCVRLSPVPQAGMHYCVQFFRGVCVCVWCVHTHTFVWCCYLSLSASLRQGLSKPGLTFSWLT